MGQHAAMTPEGFGADINPMAVGQSGRFLGGVGITERRFKGGVTDHQIPDTMESFGGAGGMI